MTRSLTGSAVRWGPLRAVCREPGNDCVPVWSVVAWRRRLLPWEWFSGRRSRQRSLPHWSRRRSGRRPTAPRPRPWSGREYDGLVEGRHAIRVHPMLNAGTIAVTVVVAAGVAVLGPAVFWAEREPASRNAANARPQPINAAQSGRGARQISEPTLAAGAAIASTP